jgi:hypothetical protein
MFDEQLQLKELREAYLRTNYVVDDGAVQLTLRIDERNIALDDLLSEYKKQVCAFITACNPRSKPLSKAENKARHRELLNELEANHYQYFHGYGASETSDWEPEKSVLIVGINYETALDLARRYDQNAFVYIERDCPPVLVWSN